MGKFEIRVESQAQTDLLYHQKAGNQRDIKRIEKNNYRVVCDSVCRDRQTRGSQIRTLGVLEQTYQQQRPYRI